MGGRTLITKTRSRSHSTKNDRPNKKSDRSSIKQPVIALSSKTTIAPTKKRSLLNQTTSDRTLNQQNSDRLLISSTNDRPSIKQSAIALSFYKKQSQKKAITSQSNNQRSHSHFINNDRPNKKMICLQSNNQRSPSHFINNDRPN